LYDSILSSRDAVRGITMVGTPGSYYLSRPEWDFGIEQR